MCPNRCNVHFVPWPAVYKKRYKNDLKSSVIKPHDFTFQCWGELKYLTRVGDKVSFQQTVVKSMSFSLKEQRQKEVEKGSSSHMWSLIMWCPKTHPQIQWKTIIHYLLTSVKTVPNLKFDLGYLLNEKKFLSKLHLLTSSISCVINTHTLHYLWHCTQNILIKSIRQTFLPASF